ncbi:MAG: M23 family metallopeptidase [Candidatus Acidiferrum sp.]
MKLSSAIALFATFALAAAHTPASREPQHPARKPASATPPVACAAGAKLFLSAPTAAQGGLLLGGLVASAALRDVQATWQGEKISIWQAAGTAPGASLRWHALLPVDLERAPGPASLTVSAEESTGEKITCQMSVAVTAGKFATENLKVAPQFVEPDPEQLARAKNEAQRLREMYATVTPEKLWKGKFRVPLDGARNGANFGRRRVLNGEPSSPHTGVDFPAPTGTPVHAAQAGRVVLAEPLYFAGNTVLIDHGLGVYTLYGHLSQIAVKVGDSLAAGAVLGRVGATGRVTGPHLHWGLTINRAHVNALEIVRLGAI